MISAPSPARLVRRTDVQGREVPDVLALDRDPEADDLAVDLADPEAVRIVAEGAPAERQEALAGLGRSRAGRPAAGTGEMLGRLADHGVGRPEIGRRRAADEDPLESFHARHVRHVASMDAGAAGGRVPDRALATGTRRRNACQIVVSTDASRS